MGFLQSIITVSVESVSMFIILQSTTTQDIVFNFIAVAIISDFDNFVFNSLRNEKLKDLVKEETSENLLLISFTSSPKAKSFKDGGEASDQVDENGEPVCLKIDFWADRSCFNKTLFLVYRIIRSFFVGIYFYFYPPMSIILTF